MFEKVFCWKIIIVVFIGYGWCPHSRGPGAFHGGNHLPSVRPRRPRGLNLVRISNMLLFFQVLNIFFNRSKEKPAPSAKSTEPKKEKAGTAVLNALFNPLFLLEY